MRVALALSQVLRALRMRRLVLIFIAAIAAMPCAAEEMAIGFVYLRDVDPTILQDMRYAGTGNFTGHAVNGYDASECVLVRKAAEGLPGVKRVQPWSAAFTAAASSFKSKGFCKNMNSSLSDRLRRKASSA